MARPANKPTKAPGGAGPPARATQARSAPRTGRDAGGAGSAQLLLGPGPTVGHALAASPLVDKIAFTGGTATGRKIMEAATGNLKKTTLELGGKSPNIVFADADFEVALEYAMFGIYAGQGEVCSAGSRLLLQKSLADRFLPRLAEASNKIIVGD